MIHFCILNLVRVPNRFSRDQSAGRGPRCVGGTAPAIGGERVAEAKAAIDCDGSLRRDGRTAMLGTAGVPPAVTGLGRALVPMRCFVALDIGSSATRQLPLWLAG